MKTFVHLWQYLPKFYLEWLIFQTKVVEKVESHILFSITFSENRAMYEVMWKNVLEPDGPQTAV